jgi:hypothetical protein
LPCSRRSCTETAPPGLDIAKAAIAAARSLDDERAGLYTDIVMVSVHAAARAILEGLTANGYQFPQRDFWKNKIGKWKEEGRAQALFRVLAALIPRDGSAPGGNRREQGVKAQRAVPPAR